MNEKIALSSIEDIRERARELTQKNYDAQLLQETEQLLAEIRAKIKKTKSPKEKNELGALRERLEETRKNIRRRLGIALNDKRSPRSKKKGRKPRRN